jgi:hypothetical protein
VLGALFATSIVRIRLGSGRSAGNCSLKDSEAIWLLHRHQADSVSCAV